MTAQETALMEVVAKRFLAAKERLADEMLERIRAEVTDFAEFDGPELGESVRSSCRANIEEGVGRMAHGDLGVPEAMPPDARDLARLTASAQNASAAAAMLGVHEHTVGYRLRTIEERLGRPVIARRAELETALRLLDARMG
jgi:PucR C-terminal helix-turn-helix domain